MQWLDPIDCRAARECLERGDPAAAARILLQSPQRGHRAARQLLWEANQALVRRAEECHCQGDLPGAWEALECARQCADLPPQAAALHSQIAAQREELQRQKQWVEGRIEQAQAWAHDGRVVSALDVLSPLAGAADAGRLRLELEERLARFTRYLAECRQHLAAGHLTAARKRLRMAQAIQAENPEIVALDSELHQAEERHRAVNKRRASDQTTPARPVTARSLCFGVTDVGWVVSQHEATIGNPRGEAIQVPIQARLHRRHALLARDRGRYRLVPYEGCLTLVNGAPATEATALQHGDVLELGGVYCRWRFLLPVAGSATAVLEQTGPGGACVQTADGRQYRRVFLVDDRLEIRRRPPAHWVFPGLPATAVCLRWTDAGLVAEAQAGTVTLESLDGTGEEATSLLRIPGRLAVGAELSEADRLGRAIAGDDPSEQFSFDLRCPRD